MSNSAAFVGSIPETYHRCLGSLLFEPYARDLAARATYAKLPSNPRILELACGTGFVTRHLLAALPANAKLTATDLNEGMLDIARPFVGADPRVVYQKADACKLPFADGSFDLILCQYGVMFFPGKAAAMREARRVLAPGGGGRYLFNVWDSLEHNPIPGLIQQSLDELLAPNPPRFLAQTPYGWSDVTTIERTAREGGFTTVKHELVSFPSESPTATDAARGLIEGTPNLMALHERGITDPSPLTAKVAERLVSRFGSAPCRSTMRAYVFDVS